MHTETVQSGTKVDGSFEWQFGEERFRATDILFLPEGRNKRFTGFIDYATENEKIITVLLEPDIPTGQHEFDKKWLKLVGYQTNGYLAYAHSGTYSADNTQDSYQLEADLDITGYNLPIHINLNVTT